MMDSGGAIVQGSLRDDGQIAYALEASRFGGAAAYDDFGAGCCSVFYADFAQLNTLPVPHRATAVLARADSEHPLA